MINQTVLSVKISKEALKRAEKAVKKAKIASRNKFVVEAIQTAADTILNT